jgi:hypothetical protein
VAASVIQWLGTNCGLGFIWQVEQAIEKAEESARVRRRRGTLQALRKERDERRRSQEQYRAPRRAMAVDGQERVLV